MLSFRLVDCCGSRLGGDQVLLGNFHNCCDLLPLTLTKMTAVSFGYRIYKVQITEETKSESMQKVPLCISLKILINQQVLVQTVRVSRWQTWSSYRNTQ